MEERLTMEGTRRPNPPADRPKVAVLCQDVVPPVDCEAEPGMQLLLGCDETHGEDDEITGKDFLRTRHLFKSLLSSVLVLHKADPNGLDTTDGVVAAVAVLGGICIALNLRLGQEPLGHHAVLARVRTLDDLGFSVTVVHVEDAGPLGPRVVARALRRRSRKELEVNDVLAAVANRRPDTVRARVAATNDDHLLALGAHKLRDGSTGRVVPRLYWDGVPVPAP